jgi:tyrosyl-tRNA synthetase
MIFGGFELLTAVDLNEVRKRLESDENPKNIKRDLALEIVKIFHSEDEANKAFQN